MGSNINNAEKDHRCLSFSLIPPPITHVNIDIGNK